ncbi:Ribosomal large subunit pseudouridine synthase A [hydrothermal vent metagenome]|uniref:Ribosomal large subunit pseudouridine synthase A n=1 Tax=hydrothermal vent metagenome TaxID=652676 RepID=A0A1W1EHW4_9ZZZZ
MPFVKEKFFIEEESLAFVYLMREFNLTQGESQRLIARGRLIIDGESMVLSNKRIQGEVEIVYFKPSSRGLKPIFSTSDFMLFDKPSGVLVHPKKMTTPYSMLDEVRSFAGQNANGCHRIDMETSGLFLASSNKVSEKDIKMLFQEREIKKSYLAWVDGEFKDECLVDEPILTLPVGYEESKHKVVISPKGKNAQTFFKPLHYNRDLDSTLLACYPHTGRTHQIRVHLFHMKHPIIGDPIYGTDFDISNQYLEENLTLEKREIYTGAKRLLLHANSLRFVYKDNKYILYSKEDFRDAKALIEPIKNRKFNKRNIDEKSL